MELHLSLQTSGGGVLLGHQHHALWFRLSHFHTLVHALLHL